MAKKLLDVYSVNEQYGTTQNIAKDFCIRNHRFKWTASLDLKFMKMRNSSRQFYIKKDTYVTRYM